MLIELVSDYGLGIVALIGVLALVAAILKIQAARPRRPPPPFVADIQEGRVVIERDTGRIKALLESSPFSHGLITDPPGYLAVRFRDEGPQLQNDELNELLIWLNNQQLPFSVGKGWGPAEVIHDLWSHGRIRGRFKTIYWTAPGKWHISDIYPDAA